jgi:hypothetical protein
MTKREKMKGKKISRGELEAQGWSYLFDFSELRLFFGKDTERGKPRYRIVWNSETEAIEHETRYPALPIKAS